MRSITIGNYNTWSDWHLLIEHVYTNAEEARIESTDLPSADGVYDETEVFGNKVYYDAKIVAIKLRAIKKLTGETWIDTYYKLVNLIHGKKLNVVIDGTTYSGRCIIRSFVKDGSYSVIEIEVEG